MSNKSNQNENNQKPEKYYYLKVRYDDAPEGSYAYNYISKNVKIKLSFFSSFFFSIQFFVLSSSALFSRSTNPGKP